ncbi:MAG: redoxin domain-containing protein [Armatimonadota bacterium]
MRFPVLSVAFLGLCLATAGAAQGAGLAVGSKAPDFRLRDTAGKAFQLSENLGKRVTVLDFGRFTCQPCRLAMGELQKLQVQYGGEGVCILSVNIDGPSAKHSAAPAAAELGLSFPVLLDLDLRVMRAYRVASIPHLVVVDATGVIRFVHEGYEPELPAKLTELIEKYRPALPRLLVIQGAGCEGCGAMPATLKDLQRELAGKVKFDIVPYSAELVVQYKLVSTPAQLFFDAAGKEVTRHEGQMPKDDFLRQFRTMGVVVDQMDMLTR